VKRKVAQRLKEAGAQLTSLADYANEAVGQNLEAGLASRRAAVGYDKDASATLGDIWEKRASVESDVLIARLSKFDSDNGIEKMYAHGMPDPVDTVVGAQESEKVASADFGGTFISAPTLVKLASDPRVAETFGDDLAIQLKSDPVAVFTSMPDSVKQALVDIING